MKHLYLPQHLLALLVFLLCTASAHAAASEPVTDLRVVVDISGSMKQNDPRNLRAPALRLLIGLLPDGSKAGIWTFGQYVNMQVKHGTVDATWKKAAMAESYRIHNRGLFTNIEEALQRATFGWNRPDEKYARHLILLTDGMVDISRDAQANSASRQRILHNILPALDKAGVKIHTIALSEMADHNLLKNLSLASTGWYEKVLTTEQLHKTFLRVFEKSTPVETVPIYDNTFEIDENISDMTVLLFHKDASSRVEVIAPDGTKWNAGQHPANINWHREDSYSMITMKQPTPGSWKLNADFDPDNRIIVATNIKLRTSNIPTSLLAADSLELKAFLISENTILNDRKLLELTRFEAQQHHGDETTQSNPLHDDGNTPDKEPNDGIYTATITPAGSEDIVNLSIQAISNTFSRESRQSIKIYPELADITSHPTADNRYRLNLIFIPELVYIDSISAQLITEDGNKVELTKGSDIEWFLTTPGKDVEQIIRIIARGIKANGREFTIEKKVTLPAITADTQDTPAIRIEEDTPAQVEAAETITPAEAPAAESAEPPTMQSSTEPANTTPDNEQDTVPTTIEARQADGNDNGTKAPTDADADVAADKATDEPTKDTAATTEGQGVSWLVVFLVVLGVNVAVAGAGVYAYLLWKKKGKRVDVNLEDEITVPPPVQVDPETEEPGDADAGTTVDKADNATPETFVSQEDAGNDDADDEMDEQLSSLDEFVADKKTDTSTDMDNDQDATADIVGEDDNGMDQSSVMEPAQTDENEGLQAAGHVESGNDLPDSDVDTVTKDTSADEETRSMTDDISSDDEHIETGHEHESDAQETIKHTDTTPDDDSAEDIDLDNLVSEPDAEINSLDDNPPSVATDSDPSLDNEAPEQVQEREAEENEPETVDTDGTDADEAIDVDALKQTDSIIEDLDEMDMHEEKKE